MSRLEEIKEKDLGAIVYYLKENTVFDGDLLIDHWDWLINRVEVLERDRDALEEKYEECRKDAVILHKENNRYKQALEKIANRKMSVYLTKDDMLSDFIQIANEAIGVDK